MVLKWSRCIVQGYELPSIAPVDCASRGGYYVNSGIQTNLVILPGSKLPWVDMCKTFGINVGLEGFCIYFYYHELSSGVVES